MDKTGKQQSTPLPSAIGTIEDCLSEVRFLCSVSLIDATEALAGDLSCTRWRLRAIQHQTQKALDLIGPRATDAAGEDSK